MSLKTLETAILVEARAALNNPKLRQKDIIEWSTSEVKPHDGEVAVNLAPHIGIWIAVKKECDKRRPDPRSKSAIENRQSKIK